MIEETPVVIKALQCFIHAKERINNQDKKCVYNITSL